MPENALYEMIPETVTVEHEGKQVAVRDLPFVKETPDVGTLAKRFHDSHTEVGRRIRIPDKDAKPEVIAEFKDKVSKAGYIPIVPAGPDKYEIVKPEKLADKVSWNPEIEKDFRATAHRIGLTNEQARELVGYHAELLGQMAEGYKVATADAEAGLRKELGAEYDAKVENAVRYLKSKCNPEELAFLDRTGLGNHPVIVKMAIENAALHKEDGTHIPNGGGSVPSDEEYQKGVLDIWTGKDTVSHAAWKKEANDGPIHTKIAELIRKKHGNAQAGTGIPQGD